MFLNTNTTFKQADKLMAGILNSMLQADRYPPYNIIKSDGGKYTIELAVAGYRESDVEVEVDDSVVTIKGKRQDQEEVSFLHRGIASRSFERSFNLAELEVTSATMKNGMLRIELQAKPDTNNVRKIEIKGE